jgi:hypothetical protein
MDRPEIDIRAYRLRGSLQGLADIEALQSAGD